MGQGGTGQCWIGRGGTEQRGTERDRGDGTVLDIKGRDGTGRDEAVVCRRRRTGTGWDGTGRNGTGRKTSFNGRSFR